MIAIIPPVELWLTGTLAMVGLILVSGFFSASETALFSLTHDELKAFRLGNLRERVAAELLRNPERLLTAVLFWNLLVNLVFFATGVVVAQRFIAIGEHTAAGLYSLTSLVAIILFGEVIPKSTAVVFSRRLASLVSCPLVVTVQFLDPVSRHLAKTTRLIRRTFWPHIRVEPILEADDLERAVEATHLGDKMVRQERQILHSILDLSEITVEEVMRPRGSYPVFVAPVQTNRLAELGPEVDYLVIRDTDSHELERAIALHDLTSFPKTNLESSAEEMIPIPWCANLAETVEVLRTQFLSVGSVVNEYGETIGIVTLDDMMDTILLPQSGRAERLLKRNPVVEISPGFFHVEGITTLRYLCRKLGIEYEHDLDSPLTVAGMLSEELQHLPRIGDRCRWNRYLVEVLSETKRGQIKTSFTEQTESRSKL